MQQRGRSHRGDIIAVIDIGSNSGRVVVFERDSGHLRFLGGSRASLRLVHDVDTRGELTETTMARTSEALRDFQAIATGAGASRIVAVATAAMRDAANGARFAQRLEREIGIRIEIIEGLAEAQYGFVGAVRGLSVTGGLLFDLGGGSMQITRFAKRRRGSGVSLPLGALRLSEKFLVADPPTRKELRQLRDYVWKTLKNGGVRRLASGEWLVGTGGTLRNLAKIDRQSRHYPIGGLHGYHLPLDRLDRIVDDLAAIKQKRRDAVPGLSAERSDSIVGGAVAIQTLAACVGADHILVSGQGVREGIALGLLKIPEGSIESVKEASLSSLVSRFDGWRPEAASRRQRIATALLHALEPQATAPVAMAVERAARVLDIGRSLDAVNRHEHVANILLTTELTGFTHQELALMSSIVRRAGDRHADVLPLALSAGIRPKTVNRAAVVLTLADEIEARCPQGRSVTVRCTVERDVTVRVPALPSWLATDVDERFERAYGRSLIVTH